MEGTMRVETDAQVKTHGVWPCPVLSYYLDFVTAAGETVRGFGPFTISPLIYPTGVIAFRADGTIDERVIVIALHDSGGDGSGVTWLTRGGDADGLREFVGLVVCCTVAAGCA